MTNNKIIKGEDIGEEAGDYEKMEGFYMADPKELVTIVLRRLPEKSELEKWMQRGGFTEDTAIHCVEQGFKKAIEVAEEFQKKVLVYCPDFVAQFNCIGELKRFAGVK